MNNLKSLIIGLYCLVCTSAASAQNVLGLSHNIDIDLPLSSILKHGTIYEAGIIRPIISLAIVIGLIYLTAFVYKRLGGFNASKLAIDLNKTQLNKFKIISSQSLGANKTLHVVEINGKYLVIGSTASSINLIKEFDKNSVENIGNFDSEFLSKNSQEDSSAWMADIIEKYGNEDKDEK